MAKFLKAGKVGTYTWSEIHYLWRKLNTNKMQLSSFAVVTPVRRLWLSSLTMRVPSRTRLATLWLLVSRDTHWKWPETWVLRKWPREPRSSHSSRSSTITTCCPPDTLWMWNLSSPLCPPRPLRSHPNVKRLRRWSRRHSRRDTRLVRTSGSFPSWVSKLGQDGDSAVLFM